MCVVVLNGYKENQIYRFYASLSDYAPKSKSESWFDSGSEPSSPKSDIRSTAVRDTWVLSLKSSFDRNGPSFAASEI